MTRIAVFDSGLGGLTVLEAIRHAVPGAVISYVADNAGFPYGPRPEAEVRARVQAVIGALLAVDPPNVVVIACNTASTAALAALREAHPHLPVVGTVPAIKPAAERSRSRVIGLLATPGTVNRAYIDDLAARFAADCTLVRVGAADLAALAEAKMRGEPVARAAVAANIAPLFAVPGLDVVVLGCTHYPLLRAEFEALAPWPVAWIDSAQAVARQTARQVAALPASVARHGGDDRCWMTAPSPDLRHPLSRFGLPDPVLLGSHI